MLGFPVAHWLETPQFFSERIHPEDRAATMAFYGASIERGGDASRGVSEQPPPQAW